MTIKTNPFGTKGWTPERLNSQKGKTFLITGANAGAGFEATKLLASKGAKVVMLSRNAQKVDAAIKEIKESQPDADLEFVQLDLSSLDSVRNAAKVINHKINRIDALICNAAIAQISEQKMTVDGFESQLGVNHYGHFLLSGLIFDKIDKSNGRIVVVSSLGYKLGHKRIQFEDLNFDNNYHPNNAYSHSKLAQMMFAYELERRIKKQGGKVQVHVCHPGASQTSLIREDAPFLTRALWSVLSIFAQSAEKGSWPEVLCATEDGLEEQSFYGPTQRGGISGAIGNVAVQAHALHKEEASRLWAISEEKTGFKWSLA